MRRFPARRAVLAAAALSLALLADHGQATAPELRVGLTWRADEVSVSADGPFTITCEGKAVATGDSGRVFRIQRAGEGLAVLDDAGQTLATCRPPLRVDAQSGLLKCMDCTGEHWDKKRERKYRGYFEVATAAGGLVLVNVVGMEDYLKGVVPSEMSASYPAEALKAQAVASRSAAISMMGRHGASGFDVCDGQHCQVYGGATSEHPATDEAVKATEGEVLTYDGQTAKAVYSAVCGGRTEDSASVWRRSEPYLRGRPDFEGSAVNSPRPGDEDSWREYFRKAPLVNCYQPKYSPLSCFRWVQVRTRQELEKSLSDVVSVGRLKSLRPLERGASGRISRLEVSGSEGRSVLGPEQVIRNALGGLRSSAFVVDSYAGPDGVPVVFIFWGAGWGHGVGMCQVGAVGLAEKGRTYKDILAWYYPGCELQRTY